VPDVDEIAGLPPAVALQQSRGTPGTRSSVGSVSQPSGLVRMRYSRAGRYPPRRPMRYAEDFAPNIAQGACPPCHGSRRVFEVTEQTPVPDPSLSIRERAVGAWPPAWHGHVAALLAPAASGRFERDADGAPMRDPPTRAQSRADTARRVAAGGSAHTGAPDARRAPIRSEEKRLAAQRTTQDLRSRIATLQALGPGYLAMGRSSPTLSPGELQCLRLAKQIRSNPVGVVYVLDEPTAGLHPSDVDRLVAQLQELGDAGNTVAAVEHEMRLVAASDWVIDRGPGAGAAGGCIVAGGAPQQRAQHRASRTAPYLRAASCGAPPGGRPCTI
jgi:excinuclease ABC subunit A